MSRRKPAKARKTALKDLLHQLPELERLYMLASLPTPTAKQAAKELLQRALDILDYLGRLLMSDRADVLFRDEAGELLAMPAMISLSRSHLYYHKRVVDRLRELKLGSKTGVACDARANWKSEGEIGFWAVALYNTIEVLRSNSKPPDGLTATFAMMIRSGHSELVQKISSLNKFGSGTIQDWKKVARSVLDVLRPDLKRQKQGRRKKTDRARAKPTAQTKRKREAIIARLGEMAEDSDKCHTWQLKKR